MNQEEEIWKVLAGWGGRYEVSNLGNVRALYSLGNYSKVASGELVTQCKDHAYMTVNLYQKNNIYKRARVHRLVACAFHPNPGNLPQVNHIDFNKMNNRADNLEWCTAQENHLHASNHIKDERLKFKPVIDTSTGTVYESVGTAARSLGVSRSGMAYRLKHQTTSLQYYKPQTAA